MSMKQAGGEFIKMWAQLPFFFVLTGDAGACVMVHVCADRANLVKDVIVEILNKVGDNGCFI
jgi:hypothetical protein